ncbi:MAG: hypothetical protein HPY55_10470 [Firmicutes bacterium]|nr:hypothetical protein [Bacillota bacterium]
MSRRGAGVALVAVAAFLQATRYLSAAVFGSGISSWSSELFDAMFRYVGPDLSRMALLSLSAGVVYLLWAEITERRSASRS